MLDSEGSEVSVTDQIAPQVTTDDKPTKNLRMLVSRDTGSGRPQDLDLGG